jgi:hypothetical protein
MHLDLNFLSKLSNFVDKLESSQLDVKSYGYVFVAGIILGLIFKNYEKKYKNK